MCDQCGEISLSPRNALPEIAAATFRALEERVLGPYDINDVLPLQAASRLPPCYLSLSKSHVAGLVPILRRA
jgi:hypothetical protein